jgi:hypothetical protein
MDFCYCDDLGDAGFSWITDEPMTRTSHVLALGGRTWLVDPVDWPEAVDRARSLGEPAGVIQLLDRHNRDCAALAGELDVPHHVVPDALPGTPFAFLPVLRRRPWREVALRWPDARLLVVAEALGTNPFFRPGDAGVGVHGLLRLTPPRGLIGLEPEHLLVGHGEGLHGADTAGRLDRALHRSRLTFFSWAATLPLAVRDARRSGQGDGKAQGRG